MRGFFAAILAFFLGIFGFITTTPTPSPISPDIPEVIEIYNIHKDNGQDGYQYLEGPYKFERNSAKTALVYSGLYAIIKIKEVPAGYDLWIKTEGGETILFTGNSDTAFQLWRGSELRPK